MTCAPLPPTSSDACSVCPLFWHFDMCERGEMALKAFCWRLWFVADPVVQAEHDKLKSGSFLTVCHRDVDVQGWDISWCKTTVLITCGHT